MPFKDRPPLIAVGGLMGAGKTSLCSYLGGVLDVHPVLDQVDRSYVKDLFRDRARWAFEAQLSFFVHKATAVAREQRQGHAVVLDRSLQEDRDIFARYFLDAGFIDSRAMRLYDEAASFVLDHVPAPDALLFLDVSPTEAAKRIDIRRRGEECLYPSNHLVEMAERYATFIKSYRYGLAYRVDTEMIDLRVPQNALDIALEVRALFPGLALAGSPPPGPAKTRYLVPYEARSFG